MYIFLIVIHIIVCLILIVTILLQAGRGGGLTEAFGGGGGDSVQSMLGTQAPVIIKKATTISAIAFLVTSLVLGMVTARRGRSLFDRANIPGVQEASRRGSAPAAAAERPGKGNEVMPAKKSMPQAEEGRPMPENQ
jgi:preprotein translocase subunit SecG